MRMDVTRSLLVWPAAAAALIVMGHLLIRAGWLTDPVARLSQATVLADQSESFEPQLTGSGDRCRVWGLGAGFDPSSGGPLVGSRRSPERTEYGSRAVQPPKRLERLLSTDNHTTLRAPRIDEQHELAGLAFPRIPPLQDPTSGSRSITLTLHPPAQVAADNRTAPTRPGSDTSLPVPSFAPPRPSLAWSPRQAIATGHAPAHEPTLRKSPSESIGVLKQPSAAYDEQTLRGLSSGSPAGWPTATRLQEQLNSLSRIAGQASRNGSTLVTTADTRLAVTPAQRWAEQVSKRLAELNRVDRLGSQTASDLLRELSIYAAAGIQSAERSEHRQEQIHWLTASHAIDRRVAVWRPIWNLASQNNNAQRRLLTSPISTVELIELVETVRSELAQTGDQAGWETYLLLDEVVAAAAEQASINVARQESRALVAQRFLSRLEWHGLDPAHREWLDRDSLNQLATSVRPWTNTAIDYARLLEQIERQESDSIDLASIEIANAVQSLRFSDGDEARDVADAVDTYYRNANVRLAISAEMLQRLLPRPEPQTVPVRAQIFGSQVTGVSEIESDLSLNLKPSANCWSLDLRTTGHVQTRSTGRDGPVAVRTTGRSEFAAATPIVVTADGVRIDDSSVDVVGRSRLNGIETDYDGWPLVGTLLRSIAASRYRELAPRSNRYANRRIEQQVESELSDRMHTALDQASTRLSSALLGPLGKLQLDPMVVDMETTPQRLLSRYRVAGDWQLAAYTPRPRAPGSSLMSVQVHQSAINNTLERLVPRDEPKTIAEMVRDVTDLFEQQATGLPDEIPEDVTIQFAPTRPITVEIETGKIWVTLRIIRLTSGNAIDLRRFIVRACYRPQLDGLSAMLVREGHLSISGPRISMRERLPVRAIFNKVLSPNRPWQLTLPALSQHPALEDLVISQFELRDGWIGLAISEPDAARIALRPSDD